MKTNTKLKYLPIAAFAASMARGQVEHGSRPGGAWLDHVSPVPSTWVGRVEQGLEVMAMASMPSECIEGR